MSTAADDTLLPAQILAWPAESHDAVAFVHGDQVWTVDRRGGEARALTSTSGQKLAVRYSPDGKSLAFSGESGDGIDVFVMGADGTGLKQLTYDGAFDVVTGWTPDSASIVFTSRRASITHPVDRLFTVSREGGLPSAFPMSGGGPAAFSPDGGAIAYNRISPASWSPFRNYRGGRQSFLSVYDVRRHQVTDLPHAGEAQTWPSWLRSGLYFVSDRDGTMNLYRRTGKSRAVQLTHDASYGIAHASADADGNEVVYERDGGIERFDVRTGRVSPLLVTMRVPAATPRQVSLTANFGVLSVSDSGREEVVGGRGRALVMRDGAAIATVGRSGERIVAPAISPEGGRLAYFSDRSGEYDLYVRTLSDGADRRIAAFRDGFRSRLKWSPRGDQLLYAGSDQTLYRIDLGPTPAPTAVVRSRNGPVGGFNWSRDGSSVAYALNGDNRLGRLWLYSVATHSAVPLTAGRYDDDEPTFDSTGRYLYFVSSRRYSPTFDALEQQYVFENGIGLYRFDLTTAGHAGPPEDRGLVRVDVPFGSYARLASSTEGLLFVDFTGDTAAVKIIDVATGKPRTLIEAATYAVARKAPAVAYFANGTVGSISTAGAHKAGDGAVAPQSLLVDVDDRAERRQMFEDAWRFARDYFYDPAMRRIDWRGVRSHFERQLPSVSTRNDLTYLLQQMLSTLGTSHAFAGGGDAPHPPRVPLRLIGAEFAVDHERYRIARILQGDASVPDTRSPLRDSGADARAGDYVVAIDGRPLTAADNVYERLASTTGTTIEIALSSTPDGAQRRVAVVTPTGDEMPLRRLEWVRHEQETVDRLGAGKIAYIPVPDTAVRGIVAFSAAFYAQSGRSAKIVDARWNGGGRFPSFFIERLTRVPLTYEAPRIGRDLVIPEASIPGPAAMLVNGYTGSGGDAFAYFFRKASLGPIVGTRTSGFAIGNVGAPTVLIDGGFVDVPALAGWDVRRGRSVWVNENYGVDPDFAVAEAPLLDPAGRDPQLEAAVRLVLARLRGAPATPRRPAYPASHGAAGIDPLHRHDGRAVFMAP